MFQVNTIQYLLSYHKKLDSLTINRYDQNVKIRRSLNIYLWDYIQLFL